MGLSIEEKKAAIHQHLSQVLTDVRVDRPNGAAIRNLLTDVRDQCQPKDSDEEQHS